MKDPNEMTDQEIADELALLKGWNLTDNGFYIKDPSKPVTYETKATWRPCESHDQCWEIQKALPYPMRYLENLCHIVGGFEYSFGSFSWKSLLIAVINATAREKAEALLITLREVQHESD